MGGWEGRVLGGRVGREGVRWEDGEGRLCERVGREGCRVGGWGGRVSDGRVYVRLEGVR